MSKNQGGQQLMGFWMLVGLVAGNMVGSGIFLLPSSLASIGTISLFSWLFTSAGAVLLALVFADMSKRIPNIDGGPYIYIREGIGKFMGFQTGFGYWVSLWIGNCAIVIATVGYLQFFFPALENHNFKLIFSIALVWLFTFFNMMGPKSIGAFQLITMIAKSLPMVLIILAGWFFFDPSYLDGFNRTDKSDLGAFSAACSATLWAFIGLESASVAAGKVKNPEKTIPMATIVGTVLAATIYIGTSLVLMGMIPTSELAKSTAPFAAGAKVIIGDIGGVIIAVTAVIACLGTLNGWIMMTAVVSKSIAETNLMPQVLAKENSKGAPWVSLLLSGVLMTILLFFSTNPDLVQQFNLITLMAVLSALIPYFYTSICNILILKYQEPFSGVSRVTIIIAALAAIYSFWTIIGSGQKVVFYGSALLLFGTPLYAIAEWNNQNKKHKV